MKSYVGQGLNIQSGNRLANARALLVGDGDRRVNVGARRLRGVIGIRPAIRRLLGLIIGGRRIIGLRLSRCISWIISLGLSGSAGAVGLRSRARVAARRRRLAGRSACGRRLCLRRRINRG